MCGDKPHYRTMIVHLAGGAVHDLLTGGPDVVSHFVLELAFAVAIGVGAVLRGRRCGDLVSVPALISYRRL